MTPNNARFAKFVGYPMLGLILLAFAIAATTPDKPPAAAAIATKQPAAAARETDEQRTARVFATWVAYDAECVRLPDEFKAYLGDRIGTVSRSAMNAATGEVVRRVAVEGTTRFCAALRLGE
jgi:hypothetical protein